MLADRLAVVEERIQTACLRAGRSRSEITLVAVTKKFGPEVMLEAYAAGLRVFGENYVQEFAGKRPALGDLPGAEFHLIGHLQSNKARVACDLFDAIQTIDSEKLARRLDAARASIPGAKPLEAMIEVKLSGEDSKEGADPSTLPALIAAIRDCPQLRLTGLMTMPPWDDDPERTRPYFHKLRELASEHRLPKLSMGMSHDFEVAIEEGATHIRVGRALFGARV